MRKEGQTSVATIAMLMKLGTLATPNCLATRLDSANVDSINGMFIKHMGDSSIDMNLADGTGIFGSIIHCIGLASQDHHLVSNTVTRLFLSMRTCHLFQRCCKLAMTGMGESMSLWNATLPGNNSHVL